MRRLDCGASFEQVLRDGGWRLALDALLPFAQIVTPRSEPRRFDTHFFLAELPGGIEARPTGTESDELVWATPARALEGASSGEVVLMPPTWATLLQVDAFDSAAALFAGARRRSIEPLEPSLTSEAGMRLLAIPTAEGVLRFSFEEGRGWRRIG